MGGHGNMAAKPSRTHDNTLRNLVPINALSDELLGQLISRIRVENIGKGDFLFREGDTDHQHVYLLEGRVALLSGSKEVDVVQSGSKTARFALAHQWPRKFSARAAGPVQVVRIDSRLLSDMLVRTQSQGYSVSELDTDSGDWMSRALRSRVFQQIPASNIQNVLRRMERVDTEAGEIVVREGDTGDYFYVIVQGSCRVTHDEDGRVEELARLGPGDGFGGEALVSDLPRSGTVSMVSAGALMRLSREDFIELIKRPLIEVERFPAARSRVSAGALWLDIRSSSAYAASHLPEAVNMPLAVLRQQAAGLADDIEYVVYGESTGDAAVAAFVLRERGFEARVLEGGFAALKEDTELVGLDQAGRGVPDVDEESVTTPLLDDAEASSTRSAETREDRTAELERLLRDNQAKFHKVLYQRVTELRKLKVAMQAVQERNLQLSEELQRARSEGRQGGGDQEENSRLRKRVAELESELDEVQDVLQEASAEESSHQWEKVRWQKKIDQLEAALAEQRDLNGVLREENEEAMRRLDTLGQRLAAAEAGTRSDESPER